MALITCAGVIGVGKSSMTQLLSEILDTPAVYEPIEENELLPLFYENKKEYGFVFQIDMLSRRFEMIQRALEVRNSILDRSIYEDAIFLHQLYDEGNVNRFELKAYDNLLDRMLKELEYLPKKSPDLMVILDIDFDNQLKRINKRARSFEVVHEFSDLYYYYEEHNKNYKKWIEKDLGFPKIVVDCNKIDFVNNANDAVNVLFYILKQLRGLEAITEIEFRDAVVRLRDKYNF